MKKHFVWALALLTFAAVSCSDEKEIPMPDVQVGFAAGEVGRNPETEVTEITVQLSRASDRELRLTVEVDPEGLRYGSDFTTLPAADEGRIQLVIPAGETAGSIAVSIDEGFYTADGGEQITFTLRSAEPSEGFEITEKNHCVFSPGEIVSKGDVLRLDGHTEEEVYGNVVYVDFSTNTAAPVNRTSWDLGFHCGEEFRVVLNGSYFTVATASEKTDLLSVTLDDANRAINIAENPLGREGVPAEAIDAIDGSLDGTVFAPVSDDPSQNPVYFVCSENNKGSRDQWYKVKVDRDGDGYSVSYGTVGRTGIQTVRIDKNPEYNFANLSLEDGSVFHAEPKKNRWDIVWGYNMGWAGRPYAMQDMVLTNYLNGVLTAQVEEERIPFGEFTADHLAGIDFTADRHNIGTNWRSVGADGGIFYYLYYIVRDTDGNWYKLRFLTMGVNDGGVRGRPEIEYVLL